MPGNLKGTILSVLLILTCWGLALFIKKKHLFGRFSDEFARKAVHIGVSNFAFIYLYIFVNDLIPVIGLCCFALINLYIETHCGSRRSWGTVEFPLVVAFLIILRNISDTEKVFVASALLGMGYGDGLAAITGTVFGKIKIHKTKTLEGTATVFLAVGLIVHFVADFSVLSSVLIGFVACVMEAFTPFGLDNISVPLTIYFLEVALCS